MKELQKLLSKIRQASDRYGMICDGDRIAVGVSGGKDSSALLYALAKMRDYYSIDFDLLAITVDLGFTDDDIYTPLRSFAGSLKVEYKVVRTQISDIVFSERKEKNPCSLCSKLRRGALVDAATECGANKIALGHHMNDAVETFMMSLMNEGRIGCFWPVTVYEDKGLSVIRPLIYAKETEVNSLTKKADLPIVKNPCPNDGEGNRSDMKDYLFTYEREHRGLYERILGAMERAEIDGWHDYKK